MEINVSKDAVELGKLVARVAAEIIRKVIEQNGTANIVLATGDSQVEMYKNLTNESLDWTKVVVFHLDEYIGLPESSPASFRKYLRERFLNIVGSVKAFYFINGEAEPLAECRRLNESIVNYPIDLALVGIGENGHLAFNDPPADFEIEEPYIVVSLDEKCRRQQTGEGWFKSLDEVPLQAISMSIKQICSSKQIICSVPDSRKAQAVKDCLEGPVSNMFPASILQSHSNCQCYLDKASSALLDQSIVKTEQARS
ncbi:MAG TPA: glucosamine-6-phosphate deaminase [Chryseolinea sp.]|nr:glucosamine-6-phosphate deaminase [Chryseolinea sp.]